MTKPTDKTESTQSSQAAHQASNGAGAASAKAPFNPFNPFAGANPFNPFAAVGANPFAMPVPEVFGQLVRDQIARTQALMNELAVHEGVAVQRARTAVDDLARLTTDSIGYLAQLAGEWRKLSLETMQRTADAFAPRA